MRRICFVAVLAFILSAGQSALGQGQLETLREDVRVAGAGEPVSSEPSQEQSGNRRGDDDDSDGSFRNAFYDSLGESGIFDGAILLGAFAAASPFWAPHAALGDNFAVSRSFARFPYNDTPGYMKDFDTEGGRLWSARFSADFADTFNDLQYISGRLQADAGRWGLDASGVNFQERLGGGRHDSLWLGDCNAVFCFARNEHMQWRTGLGFNWLDDRRNTDFGFNFTYGFDWFPRKPWVISADIDLGNLGHAGLFHFRGTAGAVLNRFEVYTGYEYYDFDRVQTNALIGGVKVWF